jgi:hypothetical protein
MEMDFKNSEILDAFFSKEKKTDDPVRDAVDNLYRRVALQDVEARDQLDALWGQVAQNLRSAFVMQRAIIQCDTCGGGMLGGEDCPYCGRKSSFEV